MKEFDGLGLAEKGMALQLFNELLQNEQQKAAQAVQACHDGHHFGGTSVTALVTRPPLSSSLSGCTYETLAERIADAYISEAEKMLGKLPLAFTPEEVQLFGEHGLFYGVHISPKLLAICEGIVVVHKDLLLDGFPDPYELPKHSRETIEEYFVELGRQRGLDLDISSLILADTTVPCGYEGKKILNPAKLNQKLSRLSALVTAAIRERGMLVDPLYLICTDTDSPHRVLLAEGHSPLRGYPLTPGVTMCGSTAEQEGFDFVYMYRMGLISQQLSGNIVSSRISNEFVPFVFFGLLSPFGYVNGAIDTGRMDTLRYSGNIDLRKEFLFQYERKVSRMLQL